MPWRCVHASDSKSAYGKTASLPGYLDVLEYYTLHGNGLRTASCQQAIHLGRQTSRRRTQAHSRPGSRPRTDSLCQRAGTFCPATAGARPPPDNPGDLLAHVTNQLRCLHILPLLVQQHSAKRWRRQHIHPRGNNPATRRHGGKLQRVEQALLHLSVWRTGWNFRQLLFEEKTHVARRRIDEGSDLVLGSMIVHLLEGRLHPFRHQPEFEHRVVPVMNLRQLSGEEADHFDIVVDIARVVDELPNRSVPIGILDRRRWSGTWEARFRRHLDLFPGNFHEGRFDLRDVGPHGVTFKEAQLSVDLLSIF